MDLYRLITKQQFDLADNQPIGFLSHWISSLRNGPPII
jgi:hypothetical protein